MRRLLWTFGGLVLFAAACTGNEFSGQGGEGDAGASSGGEAGSSSPGDGGAGTQASGGAAGEGGVSAGGGRETGAAGAAGIDGGGGGNAGEGGGDPGPDAGTLNPCANAPCSPHATCTAVDGVAKCQCESQFHGDGETCVRHASCQELHDAEPELASGEYVIQPLGSDAEFAVYCDMETGGGGWTLTFNEGPSIARDAVGVTSATCFVENCVNRAYSTVPISTDLMIDVADADMVGRAYEARVIITGVHASTVNHTVRDLFTSLVPLFAEKEDNSNVEVLFAGAGNCDSLPNDFSGGACGPRVFTFSDRGLACNPTRMVNYAIGLSESYTMTAFNCAGWPESPNQGSGGPFNWWPDNFRFWVR